MAKIIGIGVDFQRGDGGDPVETFTNVAQLTAVNWTGRALDAVETTDMDVADFYRTFIGGLINPGQLAIEGFYDEANATHANLQSDMDNRTLRNFKLVFPAPISKTFTIAALVTGFDREVPIDAVVRFSSTMQISGLPTVA